MKKFIHSITWFKKLSFHWQRLSFDKKEPLKVLITIQFRCYYPPMFLVNLIAKLKFHSFWNARGMPMSWSLFDCNLMKISVFVKQVLQNENKLGRKIFELEGCFLNFDFGTCSNIKSNKDWWFRWIRKFFKSCFWKQHNLDDDYTLANIQPDWVMFILTSFSSKLL